MTKISSGDYRAERARVVQLIANYQLDAIEGEEQLANLDVLIACTVDAETTEARRAARLKQQAEVAAQGERAYNEAFRRIGREPPDRDYGAFMAMGAMVGERTGRAIGVPVPGMAGYYAERRGNALELIEKLSQSMRA